MNMMRKGQILGVPKGVVKERVIFLNQIFGVVAQKNSFLNSFSYLKKFWQHNHK